MTMGSGLPGRTSAAGWFAGGATGDTGEVTGVITGVGVSVGGVSDGADPEGVEESDGAAEAEGDGVVSGGAPVVGLHPTWTGFGVGLPTSDGDGLFVGESVGEGVSVGAAVGVGVAVAVATATATVGLLVGVGAVVNSSAAAVPTKARITTPARRMGRKVEKRGRRFANEVLTRVSLADEPGRSFVRDVRTEASLVDITVNSHLSRWKVSLVGGRSRTAARPGDTGQVGIIAQRSYTAETAGARLGLRRPVRNAPTATASAP
jgi:hypothetical protein